MPKEILSDGFPNLISRDMKEFYRKWGITIRISSVHYPHSNGRAEALVKAAKRVSRSNVRADDQLNTCKLCKRYCNTSILP